MPVSVAARVMKKDQQFIRQGIILGFLKFGVAFKKEGSSQYDYYISPMSFGRKPDIFTREKIKKNRRLLLWQNGEKTLKGAI